MDAGGGIPPASQKVGASWNRDALGVSDAAREMEKASLSYRPPLPGVAVRVCVEDRRLDRVAVELPDGIQRLGDVAPVDSLISTRVEVVVVGIPFVLHLLTAVESDREGTEERCRVAELSHSPR